MIDDAQAHLYAAAAQVNDRPTIDMVTLNHRLVSWASRRRAESLTSCLQFHAVPESFANHFVSDHMFLAPSQQEDMTGLAVPRGSSSMHGAHPSHGVGSFSILPSSAQLALSFKEAFSTYEPSRQISTLADLLTIIYDSMGIK